MVAGLDIADQGRNQSVFTPRQGPVVWEPTCWQGLDPTETAHRAADLAEELRVQTVFYDSIGVGAGTKSTWASWIHPGEDPDLLREQGGRKLTFATVPVNTGSAPSDLVWPDDLTSREKFHNLRAELWWIVRDRFRKAYEFKIKGTRHPAEEMISIPMNPQLIGQLSLPKIMRRDNGKLQLESKDKMRERGIQSPDLADSLITSFMPSNESVYATARKNESLVDQRPRDLFVSDYGPAGYNRRNIYAADEELEADEPSLGEW